MRLFKILCVLSVVFVPSLSFAWGPMTHIYLGSELFSLATLLPAGIYGLLKRYRHDFLYGNLMADIIIGKKFIPEDKNPHSWDMGLGLLGAARTAQQEAFVYGYLSHLAADTVAHGSFTQNKKNLAHTLVEMRADSLIDKKYWLLALNIDRRVQMRNDHFLERSLDSSLLSFKTNKRIFKGMLLLSCFNKERLGDFIERNAVNPTVLTRENIEQLHTDSMERMIDVLCHGRSSAVLKQNPMVSARHRSYQLLL